MLVLLFRLGLKAILALALDVWVNYTTKIVGNCACYIR